MNSVTEFVCNNTENLCFKFVFNLSNIPYNNISNPNTYILHLSENSSSYWIKISTLFILISFGFFTFILQEIFICQNLNEKYIEVIEFTDENQYFSLIHQEFQPRYGQRSSIDNKKPYHLYS